uniref:RRM domain-containing protein n=1 Tax=Populus alba TaxID=43335 RepID=A0A4V6A9V9_POPAL|nr:hypothetical protein D5086_0000106960 [Populus alba]
MPLQAMKPSTTVSPIIALEKIQPALPPPNDDEAAPQNLPSNEVEERQDVRFKVFVGGLDNYATEEDLGKFFDKVGVVTKVRLSHDPESHWRVAFLTFATVKQANYAIYEISDPVSIESCYLHVFQAATSCSAT